MIRSIRYIMSNHILNLIAKRVIDTAAMLLAFSLAVLLVPDSLWNGLSITVIFLVLPLLVLYRFTGYYVVRHSTSIWRYTSVIDLLKLIETALFGSVLLLLTDIFVLNISIPILVLVLEFMLFLFFAGAARITVRRVFESYVEALGKKKKHDTSNVLIYGAGRAGELLLRNIETTKNSGINVIGIVDDDPFKLGRRIRNVPVLGAGINIRSLVEEHEITDIYFAIASLSGVETRRLLRLIEDQLVDGVTVKTVPGLRDLIDGRVTVNQLREIEITDLLRRKPVELDPTPVIKMVKGKSVIVVGGGGSIGSELCRQLALARPRELLVMDSNEHSLYQISEELKEVFPKLPVRPIVMDATNEPFVRRTFEAYRPDHVFHAAAYKHVPLMEANTPSAVFNNVLSTIVLGKVSREVGVKRFVLISTDKAVQPLNVMGATKRICELIMLSMSNGSQTQFMGVRFGNVLDSSGSVVPKFREQIKKGGPVTVTHPDITRYFMLIPEAVELVLQAGAMGRSGSIYVLNMGDPVKIRDLAEYMIKLSGLIPNEDIKIEYTGLRPGEKLHESLYLEGEECNTSVPDLMILNAYHMPDEYFINEAEEFAKSCHRMSGDEIRRQLQTFVPAFTQKPLPDLKQAPAPVFGNGNSHGTNGGTRT